VNDEPLDRTGIRYYQKRIRLGERMSLLLKAYAFAGIVAFLLGIGFLVYSKLRLSLSADETSALSISFVGILMTVISYGALSYRKAIYERDVALFAEHQSVGRFIDAWARFEEAITTAAFDPKVDETRVSIRETLRRLRSHGKLSTVDQITADELLQMRNSIVHGSRRFSTSELEKAIDQLVELITKVS
jgi:hypothetical protein